MESKTTFDLLSLTSIGDTFVQGICITDKNGIIQYVNHANEVIFNIPSTEAIGHSVTEFTTGMEQVINNASSVKGIEKQTTFHSICTIKSTNKSTLQYTTPIYDEKNEIAGFLVTDQDIAKFLETKKLLEESDARNMSHSDLLKSDFFRLTNPLLHKDLPTTLSSTNPAYKQAIYVAAQASHSDVTVLILGETGCGKEVFANFIHSQGERADQPFIKINASAIPKDLLESELFGYEKGSFTGASTSGKPGYFELANHGTLLLDEIGELPLDFQAKLLRVLQEKQVTRIGGSKPIDLDIKLLFATNRDLSQMVKEGTFRQDLFYRINILPIHIPALREHTEDIDTLTNQFLDKYNQKYKKHISLSPSVYRGFKQYSWPGNIRELQNVMERWVVTHPDYAVIHWHHVKPFFFPDKNSAALSSIVDPQASVSYQELMDEYQREILIWAKEKYKTSREMAKALQLDHSTICKKAKRLGLKF